MVAVFLVRYTLNTVEHAQIRLCSSVAFKKSSKINVKVYEMLVVWLSESSSHTVTNNRLLLLAECYKNQEHTRSASLVFSEPNSVPELLIAEYDGGGRLCSS
jgi:hypothetical protein